MNIIYEFLNNDGTWKLLHVSNWQEAVEKSKEYGYPVRKVRMYVIEETFNPNIESKIKDPDDSI